MEQSTVSLCSRIACYLRLVGLEVGVFLRDGAVVDDLTLGEFVGLFEGLEFGVLLDGVIVDGLLLSERVGLAVGTAVGAFVGRKEGNEVGLADDLTEGWNLGLVEGMAVGITVDGERDGLAVHGIFVGDLVGSKVLGFMEGILLVG